MYVYLFSFTMCVRVDSQKIYNDKYSQIEEALKLTFLGSDKLILPSVIVFDLALSMDMLSISCI